MIGILSALSSTSIHSGTIGPIGSALEKAYVSVFGGGGSSTRTDIHQYGTAFYFENRGGPLAVNAFGKTDSRSVGFVGGQVGYQWSDLTLNAFNSALAPAVELEGYYITKTTYTSHDISNNTARLKEHDFLVAMPIETGVFLANAVANFNCPHFNIVHPYVGAGIGGAVVSVDHAKALQVAPPEPGINHFNSNPSDNEATFAGQVKVGLNADISENFSIFAEYRRLYLASTTYYFGSTVYPGHPETSNWLVKLNPQNFNLGSVGLRYNFV